jgi:hypothetical protein
MAPVWLVFVAALSACEFDCHSNLCGDNSTIPIVNYTFYTWTLVNTPQDPAGSVRTPLILATLDLSGRGITSIAVDGFTCSNWTVSGGASLDYHCTVCVRCFVCFNDVLSTVRNISLVCHLLDSVWGWVSKRIINLPAVVVTSVCRFRGKSERLARSV